MFSLRPIRTFRVPLVSSLSSSSFSSSHNFTSLASFCSRHFHLSSSSTSFSCPCCSSSRPSSVLLASSSFSSIPLRRSFSSSSFLSFSSSSSSASPSCSSPLSDSEIIDRVIGVVKKFEKVDPAKVTATSQFSSDLGLDSLDAVELVMALEDEFGVEISDKDADRIVSVTDAIQWIKSNQAKQNAK